MCQNIAQLRELAGSWLPYRFLLLVALAFDANTYDVANNFAYFWHSTFIPQF